MKAVIIFLIVNITLFAQFEINAFVPFGLNGSFSSIKLSNPNRTYQSIKGDIGGELGVIAQLGYNMKLNKDIPIKSISFLLETGYYLNANTITYDYPYAESYNYFEMSETVIMNNILIGFNPKINFRNFSLGIGVGMKIPLSADVLEKSNDKGETMKENTIFEGSLMYQDKKHWNYDVIKKLYKESVSPYIKINFEGLYYFTDKLAFLYGAYIAYDFSMPYNTDNIQIVDKTLIKSYQLSYLSFMFYLGVSFGRNNN
ncbi:DUF2715 domain-containing protein [Brachyspira alvinipulli]|uniref:DUF2715 domain-containing protein n=1 Tax=Brachyspira alvinipulli TaxID=84379 RepID=UPI00047F395C|nr:DUF2715 domain-containing protein [Brachyspira alvinipulli]